MKWLLVLLTLPVFADIDSKLESLKIPDGRVSPVVSSDKLYVVNQRYSSLNKRIEVTVEGGNDFNSPGHLESRQGGAGLRFHYNSKWSFAYNYAVYDNELSDSGKVLLRKKALVTNDDYALKSSTLFVNYHTFYGKMRPTKDRLIYFDHYIALGYGEIDLSRSTENLVSLDTGFAFWLGNNYSMRVGVRNDRYTQRLDIGNSDVSRVTGYLSFGYLFGEGRRI